MHITASVFINDDESGLHRDFSGWLEKLAPYGKEKYQHNSSGEDNGDAHLKRTIMGREVVVAVTKGELDFGPWEQIFYGEFDGQRKKRVLIKTREFARLKPRLTQCANYKVYGLLPLSSKQIIIIYA